MPKVKNIYLTFQNWTYIWIAVHITAYNSIISELMSSIWIWITLLFKLIYSHLVRPPLLKSSIGAHIKMFVPSGPFGAPLASSCKNLFYRGLFLLLTFLAPSAGFLAPLSWYFCPLAVVHSDILPAIQFHAIWHPPCRTGSRGLLGAWASRCANTGPPNALITHPGSWSLARFF